MMTIASARTTIAIPQNHAPMNRWTVSIQPGGRADGPSGRHGASCRCSSGHLRGGPLGQVHEQVLQRDRAELEPGLRGARASSSGRAPDEGRLGGAAELLAGDDVPVRDERRDRLGRPGDRDAAGAQRVRVGDASAPCRGRARRRPRAAARSRRSGGSTGRSCAGAPPSRPAGRRRTRTARARPCRGAPRRAGSAGRGSRCRRRRRTPTACRATAGRAWSCGSSSKRSISVVRQLAVEQRSTVARKSSVSASGRSSRTSPLSRTRHVPASTRGVLPRVLAVDEHRAGRLAPEGRQHRQRGRLARAVAARAAR